MISASRASKTRTVKPFTDTSRRRNDNDVNRDAQQHSLRADATGERPVSSFVLVPHGPHGPQPSGASRVLGCNEGGWEMHTCMLP